MTTILERMLQNCKESGYEPTENIEKIARAKTMMFGDKEWKRCPCDGQNPERYCGSALCKTDIERDGICHCHCYKKTGTDNK